MKKCNPPKNTTDPFLAKPLPPLNCKIPGAPFSIFLKNFNRPHLSKRGDG